MLIHEILGSRRRRQSSGGAPDVTTGRATCASSLLLLAPLGGPHDFSTWLFYISGLVCQQRPWRVTRLATTKRRRGTKETGPRLAPWQKLRKEFVRVQRMVRIKWINFLVVCQPFLHFFAKNLPNEQQEFGVS